MNLKNILTAIIIVIILVGVYFYFKSNKAQAPTNNQPQTQQNTPTSSLTPATTGNTTTAPVQNIAAIDTNLGSFEVTLNDKAAPKTVANFVKLANQGFYNGLTFHRIVAGFMIQGGDPKGDGTGGPGYTVPAEIGLKHTIGAIAMARLGDQANPTKASSGSQFYITLAPQPGLDGQYSVFGYVTAGMDVVTKIGAVPVDVNPQTGEQSVPISKVIINRITIK